MGSRKNIYQSFFDFKGPNYNSYARYPSEGLEKCIYILKEKLKHIKKDISLLDIGSGLGVPAIKIALTIPNVHFTLNDISISLLESCERKWPKSINKPTLVCGNFLKTYFNFNNFDVAFCSFMLHLINDQYSFFKKVYEILKKDGVVFIVTHDPKDISSLIFHKYFPRFNEIDQIRMKPIGKITAMLEDIGFKEIEVKRIEYQITYDSIEELIEIIEKKDFSAFAHYNTEEYEVAKEVFYDRLKSLEGVYHSSSIMSCIIAKKIA
ncbi:MAG: methyltransferase domain-containing protein [Bacteroidota bacterium]|nr:methyltransferase domain-containing protein [Bacteroidota bacterium]